jgi:hypothetical protein
MLWVFLDRVLKFHKNFIVGIQLGFVMVLGAAIAQSV